MSRIGLEVRIAESTVTQSGLLDLGHLGLIDNDLFSFSSRSDTFAHVKCLILKLNSGITDAGVRAAAEHFIGLTRLDLGECDKVTDAGVRSVVEHLTGLTQLDLGGCVLITDAGVRAVAENLTGLTQLNLKVCQVTDAGLRAVAEHLTGLTRLGLAGCRVTDAGLRAVAEHLTGLTQLDLEACTMMTDEGLRAVAENLTGLTQLKLGWCDEVTNAGLRAVVEHLTGLTHFHLRYCKRIDHIPESIRSLYSLRFLDLTGISKLASLPQELESLGRLEFLLLDKNTSLGLPAELIGNPYQPSAILDYYFRGIREGKKQLNEAKLLIVGNEAAGKTSLVNFLLDGKPARPTAKTPGVEIQERINVSKWDMENSEGGNPLRLNVWDFGGQEVMYETHRFFLTARSLYVLVLEARRENARDADEIVHEWMRTVRNKAGDPPVIVVVNKADAGQDLRLDETRLRTEYPNLVDFVRTSCLDPETCSEGGKGIPELKQLIVRTVREKLEHVRDWLPVSYFEVKEALGELARKESVLEAGEYRERCVSNSISNSAEQDALLTLLDAIGVVVKYDDATLLDPNWLTTAVYRLLTDNKVGKAYGELTRDDLGHLLKGLPPEKYPPDRWGFIIEMMRRFHLCFELQDQPGRYLIPEQLDSNEPFLNWDEAGSLRFRFGYDQLPHGLIPRFIVETHDLLPRQRSAWANGVVLEKDSCKILVRADRNNRFVDVFVNSGPPGVRRGVLAIVRDRFEKVHRLNLELKPKELVPIPDRPELAVEYQWLIKLEKLGHESCLPPGSDREYRVAELLNNVDAGGRRLPTLDEPDDRSRRVVVNNYGTIAGIQLGESSSMVGQMTALEQKESEPGQIDLPAPDSSKVEGWGPLVGAGAAGALAVVLFALIRWGYEYWVTWLAVLFLLISLIAYLYLVRHQFKVNHWAKYMMFLFGGMFPVLAAMPGLKFLAEEKSRGRLEFLIDNSPWTSGFAVVGAVAFGFLEYALERLRRA